MPEATVHRGGRVFRKKKFRRGASIHDMVMAFNPETKDWEMPTICILNNAPVLRKDWGRTRPGDVDRVVFAVLPLGGSSGGGSNPLQILASIVVAVIAVYTGGAAGGLAAGAWGATAGGLVKGLVTAGIMMAGSMLIGSLFSVSTPKAAAKEADSPTYSGSEANNLARMYQPVPEGFGRMKIIPDRATNAWAVYSGNQQYLHQVFAIGRGRYEIESLMFGDGVFWSKNGGINPAYSVEVQFCEPGQKVTLFPDNVELSSEVSGQQLFSAANPATSHTLGPFSANPPGTNTNRIINSIIFPAGVGTYSASEAHAGDLRAISISVAFDFRPVDDYDNPLGNWSSLARRSWYIGTTSPLRVSFDTSVGEGRYQVRAYPYGYQAAEDYYKRAFGIMQWESLQSILPGNLSYGQSVIALKTRSTNILSQAAASRFSVIYTRKLPLWNIRTQTWSEPVPTRSFAAAVSQVARADYGGGLSDGRLDLDALWRIDENLAAKGWTFDGFFDGFNTIWALIVEMCSPYGVIPRVAGGRLTFAQDQADRPVRHIFTPENIVRGSFSVVYHTFTDDTPDDVNIEYLEEDAGFQRREVRAALPDSESRSPATRSFVGAVNRAQAFYQGVRLAAANRHRRIEFKWQSEAVGRLISIGDVAVINHPYLAAVQSGLIKAWDEDKLLFDLGQEVKVPEGQDIWLALNGRDGWPWGPCRIEYVDGSIVRLDPADYALVNAQQVSGGHGRPDPFQWVSNGQDGFATIWKIESGPEHENRVIISSVQMLDRFHFDITAINDAPEAYGYQDLPVPAWGFRDYIPSGAELTAPENLTAQVSGTEEEPILILAWLPVLGASSYIVEYSNDNVLWRSMADAYTTETRLIVSAGYAYVRIAGTNRELQGPWGVWEGDVNALFSPTTEIRLAEPYHGGDLSLVWTPSENAVGYNIAIRPTVDWTARTISVGLSDQFSYTPAMGLADGGPWRELTVRLETIYPAEVTRVYDLEIKDRAPAPPTEANYIVTADSIIVNEVAFADDDEGRTGLLIVRGNSSDFEMEGALEFKVVETLPFYWEGLEPGATYHFRIAARDAFFDFASDYVGLRYSDVLTVTTEIS